MEVDQALARLATEFVEWRLQLLDSYQSMDSEARAEMRARGLAIGAEADRLLAETITSLQLLLNQQASMPEDERVQALVRGIEFGSKVAGAIYDEFKNVELHNEVVDIMHAMARELDKIGSGRRAALAPLLDHADARVRAHAGVYLMHSMPNRVLPVLREVVAKDEGNDAHFTAFWSIAQWEQEGTQAS